VRIVVRQQTVGMCSLCLEYCALSHRTEKQRISLPRLFKHFCINLNHWVEIMMSSVSGFMYHFVLWIRYTTFSRYGVAVDSVLLITVYRVLLVVTAYFGLHFAACYLPCKLGFIKKLEARNCASNTRVQSCNDRIGLLHHCHHNTNIS